MTGNADKIQQLYEKTLCRRLALLKAADKSEGCSAFSLDQCADYLDLVMAEPERFEEHYPDCSACLENLVSIIEADRQCESDSRFTEMGCRASGRKALQHITDSHSGSQPQLLAAAARHRVSRCAAAGIGIDPRSGQGQILGCVAHIYEDGGTEPGLQVIGSQVVEREIDGRRVGVTPPLRMIQDVLSVVCKSNSVFKKHRASERSITIQVTQPHESFLSEGLSLSLAAAAALYAAFEDVSLPDNLVMSGCLEITGRIRKVSHVREKAALAVQQGKARMILAAENRIDVEKLDPGIRQKLSFSFVDTLQDLFDLLAELAPCTKRAESVAQHSSEPEGSRLVERLYRVDKYPVAGIFIVALCAGWLGGLFHEAADYFLGFWVSSGASPVLLSVLTGLLCACLFAIAAQSGYRAGFVSRMFLYALFLLLIPLGIASVKQLVPVHQVSGSISQNGAQGSEPLKKQSDLRQDVLQAKLTLQVNPAYATVLIDGIRKQPSQDGIVSVTLKKGEHFLLVSAGENYYPDDRSIDLVSNMTIPIVLHSLEAGDAVTAQSLFLRRLAALRQHKPPFDIKLWADRQDYRINDTIAFNFRSERDCYLTLIDIATSGTIKILFPNRFHPHNFIRAGVTYRVPGEDYDFDFQVTGPRGTNRVKAIATLQDQPLFEHDFSRAAFRSVSNTSDIQIVNAGMDKIQNGWTESECSIRVR